MKKYFILVIFLFSTLDCSFAKDPLVKIKNGLVRGKFVDAKVGSISRKVSFYEGIRYGKAERFSKSELAEPWESVYEATSYKSACYQFGMITNNFIQINQTSNESEDCLYLNVWVPEQYKSGVVMVWIHGGAFEIGTIFSSMYDGRQLAAEGDVIVVAINYRLGPLGFLYGGDDSNAPGNVGLLDQVLGLQWVHDNIESFGGDTNKITIFGESAGSISVGALVISPLTKGLFHRAIMQSGAPTESMIVSKEQATLKTKSYASKVGCSSNETMKSIVECLRTKPVELMVNATINDFFQGKTFWPIYGDKFMPVRHVDAMKSGQFNRDIDLMYGLCKDEGSMFVPMFLPELFYPSTGNITKELAKKLIVRVLTLFNRNHNNQEAADFYIDRLNKDATQIEFLTALSDLIGDFALACPTIFFGEEFFKHTSRKQPVYSYRLLQQTESMRAVLPQWMGIKHGSDVFFVFPNPDVKLNAIDEALSHVMIQAWSNFAKTGSPGSIGSVDWKQSIGGSGHQTYTSVMELKETGSKFHMVDNVFKDVCNGFWKSKIFV